MSRYAKDRSKPPIKPVENIQISDKNRKFKLAVIVLLLALGVTLIATSLPGLLTTPAGWETIQANANANESCAGDFVFLYLLGDGDQAANLERQVIKELYTQATRDAFQIFHEEKLFEGVHNVAYLNQHANEEVEVPSALYDAFGLLAEYKNRGAYLAPLYREYLGLFHSSQDYVAETYDPDKNPEQATYFAELLAFVTDENAVNLELLGNNRVKLKVSDAYLQYAASKEITTFLDFYWMKNAFIADYLAQQLTDAGYTKGTVSSFDGFSRNLDTTDRSYNLNLFDRVGQNVYQAGVLEYSQVQSIVSLRNYPTSELAVQLYYGWSDGSFTSCHIDPADGRSKSALNDLVGYSKTLSCSEILMTLYPVYVAEALNADALQALPSKGIQTVYCEDRKVITSDPGAVITQLYQKENVAYAWEKVNE